MRLVIPGGELEGTLEVVRPRLHWADRLRAYRVLVDGQEVGRVRNGETARFPVAAGRRWVALRIDWSGSGPLEVEVPSGSSSSVTVRWRGNLFSRDGYLELRERA